MTNDGMFQVFYSHSAGTNYSSSPPRLPRDPQFVRESLETALATVSSDAARWEIKDSSDQVIASNTIGIRPTVRASLLARQLLSRLRLTTDDAYGSISDIEVCTDVLTQGSDGAWVLSPEIGTRAVSSSGTRYRTTPVHGPVDFEIESSDTYHPSDTITIRHSSGRMRVDRRLLELRPAKTSKSSPCTAWDLAVLNCGLDGNPCSTASGVYARLGADEFAVAGMLGVVTREPADPNALPVTWKKGLIAIGSNGNRVERMGWVRGIFGIDKRQVEMEGYGDYKYHTPRYHLTHLPSGYLVEHCKRRTTVELIADTLRVEVPGLVDQETIEEEIGQKIASVIRVLCEEAGWQWDQ